VTDNPYRYVGKRVIGHDFVERSDLMWRVRATWEQQSLGNLSVQGSHRMGKSSLVARAIELDTDSRPGLLFVAVNVGEYDTGSRLFRAIARDAHIQVVMRTLPQLTPYRPALEQLVSEINTSEDSTELRRHITHYFDHLGRAGVAVVLVLDEFDRAGSVLTERAQFQFLRSLASERTALGLVTISRRPVYDIEVDVFKGSTLDGVLALRCHVGCFTDDEVDDLLNRATPTGINLPAFRSEITDYAGGHPFLLSLLCHEIVQNHRRTGEISVAAAHNTLADQFETQFATLTRGLDTATEGRAAHLLRKIAEKSADSVSGTDMDLMERLGLIRKAEATYQVFSGEFERYVRRTLDG
jgi:hypothetical protein